MWCFFVNNPNDFMSIFTISNLASIQESWDTPAQCTKGSWFLSLITKTYKYMQNTTKNNKLYMFIAQNVKGENIAGVVLEWVVGWNRTCSGREPAPPWWSSLTGECLPSFDSSLRETSAAAWCSPSSRLHSPRWRHKGKERLKSINRSFKPFISNVHEEIQNAIFSRARAF